MKTKTTTREYDADGNMVKETVTEYEQASYPAVVCTCRYGTGGYCALHGYGYGGGFIWTTPTWGGYVTTTTADSPKVTTYN